MRHGHWTRPYFDCNGFVKKWVMTYAAPFFGWDSLRTKLEFKGVVTVTMDLQTLDINQCPGKYHTPNSFKDTNKCDQKTSYVSYFIYQMCYILFLQMLCVIYIRIFLHSAFLFWAEASTLEAINANADRATSIRSKML